MTATLDDFETSQSLTESQDGLTETGERVFAIPHDLVEDFREEFTPGTCVAARGTGDIDGDGTVTSTGGAMFTSDMLGQELDVSDVGSLIIVGYVDAETVETTYHGDPAEGKDLTLQGPKVFPGRPGLGAPQLSDYRLEPVFAGRPGSAKLVLTYKTPTATAFVEPNHASLDIKHDTTTEKLIQEVVGDERIIVGPAKMDSPNDDKDDPPFQWKVVRGSNEAPLGSCTMTLKTARLNLTRDDIETMTAQVGKVNDATLVNFGCLAPGTLMLLGVTTSRSLKYGGAWDVTYTFQYRPGGFTCMVQQWAPTRWSKQPIYYHDVGGIKKRGAANGKVDIPWPLMQDDGGVWTVVPPVPRVTHHGATSFADLEVLLAWQNVTS